MAFDKKQYWKNRAEGIRGQGEEKSVLEIAPTIAKDAHLSFDNDGHLIVKNRAYRRQRVKLPGAKAKVKKNRKKK